jgi:hypothetical protein
MVKGQKNCVRVRVACIVCVCVCIILNQLLWVNGAKLYAAPGACLRAGRVAWQGLLACVADIDYLTLENIKKHPRSCLTRQRRYQTGCLVTAAPADHIE